MTWQLMGLKALSYSDREQDLPSPRQPSMIVTTKYTLLCFCPPPSLSPHCSVGVCRGTEIQKNCLAHLVDHGSPIPSWLCLVFIKCGAKSWGYKCEQARHYPLPDQNIQQVGKCIPAGGHCHPLFLSKFAMTSAMKL